MTDAVRISFFDVDGVLLDSLPQHLKMCRDKAREFGLGLEIPTVDEFRHLVNRGVRVSPMRELFLAVGFPKRFADLAVIDYESTFMEQYKPHAFEGVDRMLRSVSSAGWRLGLVTSNTRANVVPALGHSMALFDEACLFFHGKKSSPKHECLEQGVRTLRAIAANCAYVGDQPADARAAECAGVMFLGVTYGWGILADTVQFETAHSVAEIPSALATMFTLRP
jgi:phosphoglycolate phosphatase